ncbi:MAG: hypothetical protein ACYSWU_08535 [Planctomycetota bacterium]|jgi:hypothetical protein
MSVQKKLRVWPLLALLPVLSCASVLAQTTQRQPDVSAAAPASSTPSARFSGVTIPSDAVWFATMDVKRFVESRVGQQTLQITEQILEQLIREEADFEGALDLKTARAKIGKVIGFDPLEGIASVEVYGLVSPFGAEIRDEEELVERMATTGVAVVTLSGGTGNLEGLALATPDYRSTEYSGATIHSGTLPDFPLRTYMAVLKQQGNGKPNVVVFGLDEDQVKQALDRTMGKSVSPSAGRFGMPGGGAPGTVFVPAAKGTFFAAGLKLDEATIRALDIPEQQSAVFKMLTRVAVSLGADDNLVTAQLTAGLVNEQRAEQVRQLAEGAVALGELLLELPIEEFNNEEELQLLREFLKDVNVQVARDGVHVSCQVTKPVDTLFEDLMREWTELVGAARREAIEVERDRADRARPEPAEDVPPGDPFDGQPRRR